MFKIGDLVKRTNKYYVPPKNENTIYKVASNEWTLSSNNVKVCNIQDLETNKIIYAYCCDGLTKENENG